MANTVRNIFIKTRAAWNCVEKRLDCIVPVADLVARVYVARVFFLSGLNKIQDWDSTLYLFQEEYRVPILSPDVAAVMGTAGELGFSVFLAIGLTTRFSACGLFFINIMAVVSYYHVLKDSPAALQDHLEWGILLALLLSFKVKQLTLDHWFLNRKLDLSTPL